MHHKHLQFGHSLRRQVFIDSTIVSARRHAAGARFLPLAAFATAIGVAVLAVSLSHLAWAVRDVTGSGSRAPWALAVALDCSLVLRELVHVSAAAAGLDAVCWGVVVVVAGFSMVLNVHAFRNHR